MSVARRVFYNSLVLYVAEAASRVVQVFLTIAVARHLGSSELGKLAYANALLTIGLVVVDAGLSNYLIKEVAAHRNLAPKVESIVLTLRIILAVSFSLIMFLYLKVASLPEDIANLTLLAFLSIPLTIVPSVVTATLRAAQRMWFEAVFRFTSAILNTLMGLFVIFHGFGIFGLVTIAVALNFLSLLYFILVGLQQRVINFSLSFSWREVWRVVRGAFPFASVAILVVIYFRIDLVMIQQMIGADAGGRYAAAYRIMEFLFLIPTTLASAIFPAISQYLYKNTELVKHSVTRSIKLLSAITFPIVIGGILLAEQGMTLVYTKSYLSSVPILQVLLLILIPVTVSFATSTVISASKRPMINAYIALAMVTFNVGSNLLLIPQLGIMGAAASTVLTEFVALILGMFYVFRNSLLNFDFLPRLVKPALASLLVGSVILIKADLYLIPAYGFLYFILLLFFKTFEREDYYLAYKVIPRRIARLIPDPLITP